MPSFKKLRSKLSIRKSHSTASNLSNISLKQQQQQQQKQSKQQQAQQITPSVTLTNFNVNNRSNHHHNFLTNGLHDIDDLDAETATKQILRSATESSSSTDIDYQHATVQQHQRHFLAAEAIQEEASANGNHNLHTQFLTLDHQQDLHNLDSSSSSSLNYRNTTTTTTSNSNSTPNSLAASNCK